MTVLSKIWITALILGILGMGVPTFSLYAQLKETIELGNKIAQENLVFQFFMFGLGFITLTAGAMITVLYRTLIRTLTRNISNKLDRIIELLNDK